MYFLRSWKESLLVFIPKNFKNFMLVTLKNAMSVYAHLVYNFWWLLILAFVMNIGCYYPQCALRGPIWDLAATLLLVALAFVIFMVARPSVELKQFAYFKKHTQKTFIGFVALYVFFDYLRAHVGDGVLCGLRYIFKKDMVYQTLHPLASFIYDQAPFVVLPPFIFTVFFYFDREGDIRSFLYSILRGFIMFIYNFPFCLLSVVAIFAFWKGLLWSSPNYGYLLFFSFVPFVVSYFRTMYVKRLHDQFSLYYPNE